MILGRNGTRSRWNQGLVNVPESYFLADNQGLTSQLRRRVDVFKNKLWPLEVATFLQKGNIHKKGYLWTADPGIHRPQGPVPTVPTWSEIFNFFVVVVRSEIFSDRSGTVWEFQSWMVLIRSENFKIFSSSPVPTPIGFGPWISAADTRLLSIVLERKCEQIRRSNGAWPWNHK